MLAVLFNCVLYTIPSRAQTGSPDKWQGKLYDLTTHQSPFDSLRINVFELPLIWRDVEESQKQAFLSSLGNVYDLEAASIERIMTEKHQIHRYIIGNASGFTVLEKYSYGNGIILYFKNCIPEPEMKFYKLLTSYYEE